MQYAKTILKTITFIENQIEYNDLISLYFIPV